MSEDTDTTQWSLPGQAEMPRGRTADAAGGLQRDDPAARASRTMPPGSGPSRRTGSLARSPSTWGSRRGCCRRSPSGGTRERPGRWWASGGRRRSGPWPCNGRRSNLPPGSGFPCRGWSSSARRAVRPGSTPQRAGRTTPSSSSSGPRPSTFSTTGGSVPEATGSRRRSG